MRINKFLFPIILLIIFFGVIALGMAAGYWDSEGGRGPSTPATRSGRGRYQVESEISYPALVRRIDTFESGESVWQV